MVEETIDLLGKKTITYSDDNGTTGYTVFTATSLYDSYCTEASKTFYFDFSCDDNKIGIWCDDSENLIPTNYWQNELKPFLESNASFVKLYDSSGGETVAYACKVIFPPTFGIEDPDVALHFSVYFSAMTEDRQNTISMSVDYHVTQCSQYYEILLYGNEEDIGDIIALTDNSILKNSIEDRESCLSIEKVVARKTTDDNDDPPHRVYEKDEIDDFADSSTYPIFDTYRYVDRSEVIVPNITGQSSTLITKAGFHSTTPQQLSYNTEELYDHISFKFPKTGDTPICIGYKTFNFDAHRHYNNNFNTTDNPSIYSGSSTEKMDAYESSSDPVVTYDAKIYNSGTTSTNNVKQYTYRIFAANYIKQVKIPKVIQVIGNQAFKNNVDLQKVILGNGSELKVIGNYAFENCNLVYFGERYTSLPGYGLVDSEVEKFVIALPNSLELLGEGAFKNNTQIDRVFIPENLEHIGPAAFCGCDNIDAVYFHPNSKLRKIGAFAFSGCTSSDNQQVKLPEHLESIGNSAFRDADFIEKIEFPKSIKFIDRTAFYDASNLVSVTFPETCSLNKIGKWAFRNCSNLKTVKLPKNSNLTAISQGTFNGCTNFCGTYETYGEISFSKLIKSTHVIDSSDSRDFRPENVMYIPSTVTYIDDFAFEGTDIRGVVFAGSCSFGGRKEFYVKNNISYLEFLGESIITDYPDDTKLGTTLYITMTIYLWNEINRKNANNNYIYSGTWVFNLLFTGSDTVYIHII